MYRLNLDLIERASRLIQKNAIRTPIENSVFLSELLQSSVLLKLESVQVTGSFKIRGALFYVSTLSKEELGRGVAACSAGNHGLGVAYAAKEMGASCTIYVPKNVDEAKSEKIAKLGGNVLRSNWNGYDDTLIWAKQEAKKKGLHFISAFEDERIMAANGGTLAAEILEDVPDVENIFFPVGGGGMAAGLAYYFKEKKPSVRLIGCQHVDSPALDLSLRTGKAVIALPAIDTIAGGIEGGIGARCFEILKDRIDDVALVSESEIEEAFRWMLAYHQHLIEPSAIVTVAACLFDKVQIKGKTVLVLSGRNIAYSTIQRLLNGNLHKTRDRESDRYSIFTSRN